MKIRIWEKIWNNEYISSQKFRKQNVSPIISTNWRCKFLFQFMLITYWKKRFINISLQKILFHSDQFMNNCFLPAEFRVLCIPFREVRPPPLKISGVHDMTLNCIWWWGSSFGVVILLGSPSMDQAYLFKIYPHSIGLWGTNVYINDIINASACWVCC